MIDPRDAAMLAGAKASIDPRIDAAAQALLDITEQVMRESRPDLKDDPPQSSIMCNAVTMLAGACFERQEHAPFAGIARSLASMALAQGMDEDTLLLALSMAMRPTWEAGDYVCGRDARFKQ